MSDEFAQRARGESTHLYYEVLGDVFHNELYAGLVRLTPLGPNLEDGCRITLIRDGSSCVAYRNHDQGMTFKGSQTISAPWPTSPRDHFGIRKAALHALTWMPCA